MTKTFYSKHSKYQLKCTKHKHRSFSYNKKAFLLKNSSLHFTLGIQRLSDCPPLSVMQTGVSLPIVQGKVGSTEEETQEPTFFKRDKFTFLSSDEPEKIAG